MRLSLVPFRNQLANRLALHELHRDVVETLLGAGVENRHNVGVVDQRSRARLLLEAV
jgi:hypothetical protein